MLRLLALFDSMCETAAVVALSLVMLVLCQHVPEIVVGGGLPDSLCMYGWLHVRRLSLIPHICVLDEFWQPAKALLRQVDVGSWSFFTIRLGWTSGLIFMCVSCTWQWILVHSHLTHLSSPAYSGAFHCVAALSVGCGCLQVNVQSLEDTRHVWDTCKGDTRILILDLVDLLVQRRLGLFCLVDPLTLLQYGIFNGLVGNTSFVFKNGKLLFTAKVKHRSAVSPYLTCSWTMLLFRSFRSTVDRVHERALSRKHYVSPASLAQIIRSIYQGSACQCWSCGPTLVFCKPHQSPLHCVRLSPLPASYSHLCFESKGFCTSLPLLQALNSGICCLPFYSNVPGMSMWAKGRDERRRLGNFCPELHLSDVACATAVCLVSLSS